MSLERTHGRLRRLNQQIRAFRDMHVGEVSLIADRLAAVAKLQSDELQMILDELTEIVGEMEAPSAAGTGDQPSDGPPGSRPSAAVPADPASASPKRTKWIAGQERRTQVSRRELLLGRDKDGSEPAGG